MHDRSKDPGREDRPDRVTAGPVVVGGALRRPAMTAAEARRLRDRELFERLERLLVETRGNIAEIGRRMGRDRSTIRYHLRRFGMLDDPKPPNTLDTSERESR